jgi:hypothetical protein
MKLEDLTKEVEEALDVKFIVSGPYGHGSGFSWRRVNVNIHGPVTIGQLIFRDGEYYNKHVHKSERRRDICLIDQKMFRLERYILDGTIISLALYNKLLPYVDKIVEADINAKIKWRADHPKSRKKAHYWDGKPKEFRKSIKGRNPRYVLRTLILNISPDLAEFETSLKDVMKRFKLDIQSE